MAWPFSACMQINPPLSRACSITLKIVPSSTISTPGYAMNSLNDVRPSFVASRCISS